MHDVLLSLILPEDVSRLAQDLLLGRPDLVDGFTATAVDGHGAAVRLVAAGELVSGHAPRVQIQIVGEIAAMRAVIALLREQLPRANLYYWLSPVLEAGHP